MLAAVATIAIFSIFLCCWSYIMARDPKNWRLWWMNLVGYVDLTSSHDQRRKQERWLRTIAYILSLVSLLTALSCIYWAVFEAEDIHRSKTSFEKDQDQTLRELEKMKSKFRKLR